MAEKRDGGRFAEALSLLAADLVAQAEVIADAKDSAAVEAKARAVAAVMRVCAMLADLTAKEDNMSTNQDGADEARMARADELRAEIERRLARIRARLEDKSLAESPEHGAGRVPR